MALVSVFSIYSTLFVSFSTCKFASDFFLLRSGTLMNFIIGLKGDFEANM